jgi:DNA helicase-2/ATP-dependent DNA helicase PcrA
MIVIDSDSLIPIENNFRIIAGPGAGKTYWLIKHINNVLNNTKKLKGAKKIACITYTNVGADIIKARLGDNSAVDVSTIHSFLYLNIIKPYASFLEDSFCLEVRKIGGHDESTAHRNETKEWIETHPEKGNLRHPFTYKQLTRLPQNLMAICNWLISMKAEFDTHGNIEFVCDNKKAVFNDYSSADNKTIYINHPTLNKLKSHIFDYKTMLWKKGILDHEDILFLSYHLINKNPFILEIIRSKYPYFFVDEYQDTNPVQTEILKLIASDNVSVGVIGDEAQSIFGFQGAKVSLFYEDIVKNTMEYRIEDNRRSTISIVNTLNNIRSSINQTSVRDVEGSLPTILVGEKKAAHRKVCEILDATNIQVLARDNVTSNFMRRDDDTFEFDPKLIDKIYSIDKAGSSNKYRSLNIIRTVKAIEYARQHKYKDAILIVNKILNYNSDEELVKRKAVNALKFLVNQYDDYCSENLLCFFTLLKTNLCPQMPNLRSGKPKELYESVSYRQIAVCVNITDDISLSKTIHKSKGEEFENVLMIMRREKDIEILLNPDLENEEEHRVNYVGMSRATDNLFITVPSLKKKALDELSKRFNIIKL